MSPLLLAALLAAAPPAAQDDAKPGEAVVRQDITIKGKGPAAPPARVPPPLPDAAVVDEVVESLELYRGERRTELPKLRLLALQRRLDRPFPEAPFLVLSPRAATQSFERWSFEVFCEGRGERALWRADGSGRLVEPLEWNGADALGRTILRAGDRCRFLFAGVNAGARVVLESEPVETSSLAYRDNLSTLRMEAALGRIFPPGSSEPYPEAADYLAPMAERLERSLPPGAPLRLELRQKAPDSALAQRRAEELVRALSNDRVLSRERFRVERMAPGERGEVVACELPPDKGATIRLEE
ncbi:MAG: hypothetical protein WC969_02615 [Elusimicrobiota bacterium]